MNACKFWHWDKVDAKHNLKQKKKPLRKSTHAEFLAEAFSVVSLKF